MSLTNPSPNHNSRNGQAVQVIVLHADAAPTEKSCLSWIQSSESKVSYHTLVGRDGAIYTVVPYDRRAWHAGKAVWNGHKDVNGISIGVCLSNKNNGIEGITAAQKAGVQKVIADIRARYGPIPVTTHAAVSPGRKTDPEQVVGFALSDYQ